MAADASASGGEILVLRFVGHLWETTHVDSKPEIPLQLLMDDLEPRRRLEQLLATITGRGVSGVWRLAVAGTHIGDVIVVADRVCYVTLSSRPTRTLGDMLADRHPERATRIREVLKGAVARGQRLGETLALLDGLDAGPIRDCLRAQIGERLAELVGFSGRVEGKCLALSGSFDSTFTFAADEVAAAARERLAAPPPRVLFVDDDVNLLAAVQRVAKRWSIALDCEASSMSARERAMTDVYDLIVLDYILPDANGIDLSTVLRELQPGATFVLASGAMDRDELRVLAARHSIPMVLAKPFDLTALEALFTSSPR